MKIIKLEPTIKRLAYLDKKEKMYQGMTVFDSRTYSLIKNLRRKIFVEGIMKKD